MKFWDTSALLPLFVDEPATESCAALLSSDPSVIVWEGTSVELLSALSRYRRHSSRFDDLWPTLARLLFHSLPQGKMRDSGPRAAYSHCASVGSRPPRQRA